jgi:hypothetical protein
MMLTVPLAINPNPINPIRNRCGSVNSFGLVSRFLRAGDHVGPSICPSLTVQRLASKDNHAMDADDAEDLSADLSKDLSAGSSSSKISKTVYNLVICNRS